MSTPGTAKWLRSTAQTHTDIAEGLLRAANRIERLQNELSVQKTGVNQGYTPPPTTFHPPSVFSFPNLPLPKELYRIQLPENADVIDREMTEQFFDWINGSENLGLGLLDPCEIYVLGAPDVKGGTWVLDTVIGVSTLQKDKHDAGFVRISGTSRKGPLGLLAKPLNSIDLTGCYVLNIDESGDRTSVAFAAKEVKDVGREDETG